jgi:hypothetical protein
VGPHVGVALAAPSPQFRLSHRQGLWIDHVSLFTIEEGSIGGFGDHVMHFLSLDGLLDEGDLKFWPMVMPESYFKTTTQHE